jgi:hypothetical protein
MYIPTKASDYRACDTAEIFVAGISVSIVTSLRPGRPEFCYRQVEGKDFFFAIPSTQPTIQ